jgi:xanthine dehydrogenase accessory factor
VRDTREGSHHLGVSDGELARLHMPIGLDIGGRTPAEAAVSILADIIATREHRSDGPLIAAGSPLHSSQLKGL